MDTFSIQPATRYKLPESNARKAAIYVNGELSYVDELNARWVSEGRQCEYSIIDFIKKHYGQDVADKVFKEEFPWEEKVYNLEVQATLAAKDCKMKFAKCLNNLAKGFIKPDSSKNA